VFKLNAANIALKYDTHYKEILSSANKSFVRHTIGTFFNNYQNLTGRVW